MSRKKRNTSKPVEPKARRSGFDKWRFLEQQASKPDQAVVIYTDGGCWPNPGPGGWAAVLSAGGRRKVVYGGERRTTNNRMEMLAAIQGLRALTRCVPVTIYTDSQYLLFGASLWVKNWVRKGKLDQMKNPDLWLELHSLQSAIPVEWKWVKGHNGCYLNELADEYAYRGKTAMMSGDVSAKSEWLC